MPGKKTQLNKFAGLAWNDLQEWAGNRIVSRGKNYQRQGRVCDLAVTEDHGLIAWVDGTEKYATKVVMEDDGLPEAICTCPYEWDCKHAVAVVIEYLKRIEDNRPVPWISRDDARLKLLDEEDWNDEPMDEETAVSVDVREEIDRYLKGKTKAQLIDLIHEIAQQHPEVAQEIADRQQLTSGHTETLVIRLRREIQKIGDDPGWQNYWGDEGFTPDYSGIRMIGPSMPWNGPAARTRSYPCVRLRPRRRAIMNGWSITWFRRDASRRPKDGFGREFTL